MTAIFRDECGTFKVEEIHSIIHKNTEWIIYFLDGDEEWYEAVELLEIF